MVAGQGRGVAVEGGAELLASAAGVIDTENERQEAPPGLGQPGLDRVGLAGRVAAGGVTDPHPPDRDAGLRGHDGADVDDRASRDGRGRPRCAPGSTMAPAAMNASSAMVQPVSCACGPASTRSPMSSRCRAVPRSTAFSMITQPAPTCTGPPSAASTAPCMMQLPAPTLTWPLSTAEGAT